MGKLIAAVVGLLLLAGCSSGGAQSSMSLDAGAPDAIIDAAPGVPTSDAETLDAGIDSTLDQSFPETDPMIYYGGSVITAPPDIYFIWYGNWTDKNTAPILEDFMTHLSGSPWLQIVTGYYQQAGAGVPFPEAGTQIPLGKFTPVKNDAVRVLEGGLSDGEPFDASDAGTDAADTDAADAEPGPQLFVTGQLNFVKSISVGYSHGKSLMDSDIAAIVGDAIAAGKIPSDANGIYYVFTSSDVSESDNYFSFCYEYCGWHGNFNVFNNNLRIVFVGDTGACDACNLQQQYQRLGYPNPPNDDWSADSMASVIAHELAETMTDPDPNTTPSWVDDYGAEIGDKCAWVFGPLFSTSNNGLANITLGQRNYLIQEDFVNAPDGGICSMTL